MARLFHCARHKSGAFCVHSPNIQQALNQEKWRSTWRAILSDSSVKICWPWAAKLTVQGPVCHSFSSQTALCWWIWKKFHNVGKRTLQWQTTFKHILSICNCHQLNFSDENFYLDIWGERPFKNTFGILIFVTQGDNTYVCGWVGSSPRDTVSPWISLKHFSQKWYLSAISRIGEFFSKFSRRCDDRNFLPLYLFW